MDTFDIEETKKELILRFMNMSSGSWNWFEIALLPGIKELRTFVCQLGPSCALNYAYHIDKGPDDETFRAVQSDLSYRNLYNQYILRYVDWEE